MWSSPEDVTGLGFSAKQKAVTYTVELPGKTRPGFQATSQSQTLFFRDLLHSFLPAAHHVTVGPPSPAGEKVMQAAFKGAVQSASCGIQRAHTRASTDAAPRPGKETRRQQAAMCLYQ